MTQKLMLALGLAIGLAGTLERTALCSGSIHSDSIFYSPDEAEYANEVEIRKAAADVRYRLATLFWFPDPLHYDYRPTADQFSHTQIEIPFGKKREKLDLAQSFRDQVYDELGQIQFDPNDHRILSDSLPFLKASLEALAVSDFRLRTSGAEADYAGLRVGAYKWFRGLGDSEKLEVLTQLALHPGLTRNMRTSVAELLTGLVPARQAHYIPFLHLRRPVPHEMKLLSEFFEFTKFSRKKAYLFESMRRANLNKHQDRSASRDAIQSLDWER